MLLDLRSLLEAASAFAGVGVTAQSSQSTAGAGLEKFVGQGEASQSAQTSAGTGLERLIAVGATAQVAQTEAGAGVLRFIGSADTAQATQSTAGTGQTFVGFAGIGFTTQSSQTTDGEGATPTLGGGLLSRQWRRRPVFIPFLEEPAIPARRGRGGTQQAPQLMSASGEMREDEDWLLAA